MKHLQRAAADQRADEVGLLRTQWDTLANYHKARLNQILTDEGFRAAAELSIKAGLNQVEMTDLVTSVNEARSSAKQVAIVKAPAGGAEPGGAASSTGSRPNSHWVTSGSRHGQSGAVVVSAAAHRGFPRAAPDSCTVPSGPQPLVPKPVRAVSRPIPARTTWATRVTGATTATTESTAPTAMTATPATASMTAMTAMTAMTERLVDELLLRYPAPSRTGLGYRQDLQVVHRWAQAHGTCLLALSRVQVQRYVHDAVTLHGRAPATVARHLAALRALSRYGVEQRMLDVDPTVGVRLPRVVPLRPRADLSPAELRRLMDAADGLSTLAGAVVTVLVMTGARVSELVTADVGGMRHTPSGAVLRVRRKGGAPADLPLPPRAVQALLRHLNDRLVLAGACLSEDCPASAQQRPAGALLVTRRGRLHRATANRIVRQVASAALPPGRAELVHAHALRAGFCQLLLEAGVPIEVVADAAGHASVATLQTHYLARAGQPLWRAASTLEAVLDRT